VLLLVARDRVFVFVDFADAKGSLLERGRRGVVDGLLMCF